MSNLVRDEVFGSPEYPTIHYFTGYGNTVDMYRPHYALLRVMGFRIHAYQYDKAVLNGGDPTLLPSAIDEMQEIVETDSKDYPVAGIYGISLGSFIGLNILKRTAIDQAAFNTGVVSVLSTVWDNPYLAAEKQEFQKAGHSWKSMAETWREIDRPDELENKKVLLMISEGDKVLSPAPSKHNYKAWINSGVNGELVVSKRLGHGQAIFRNLLRIKRTRDFYRA